MFTAFSQGLNKIISADNVQNYKDVFLCPNPTCSAKLTLRAVNSSIVSIQLRSKPYIQPQECVPTLSLRVIQLRSKPQHNAGVIRIMLSLRVIQLRSKPSKST